LQGTHITTQRALSVVLAAHEYHIKTQRWPASLDELGQALNLSLPLDPFSGRTFGYRRTEEGFVLYSAAVDRDDDGGRHSESWGKSSPPGTSWYRWQPDGDYVFWPVQPPSDSVRQGPTTQAGVR
jgi:hypothetical protein